MPTRSTEQVIKNLDQRLERVQQFLPTLTTKDELRAEVARLATKEDLQAAIAPLATKEELRAAIAPLATQDLVHRLADETRRHFDVVAEGLRHDIRLVAEGQVHLASRFDAFSTEVDKRFDQLDQRVLRLETARPRTSGR